MSVLLSIFQAHHFQIIVHQLVFLKTIKSSWKSQITTLKMTQRKS